MKRKIAVLSITLIVTFVALFCSTFAYLTSENIHEYSISMGNVDIDVDVVGGVNINMETQINNLAYIEITNDLKLDTYGVVDQMASILTVTITSNTMFDIRPLIKLPSISTNPGLLYIVIDDINVTTYFDFVDLSSASTETAIRDAIDLHNHDTLKSLYESGNGMTNGDTLTLRIAFWGDYNALSDADKAVYLTKQFNFDFIIVGLQDISDYDGLPDYDIDGVI